MPISDDSFERRNHLFDAKLGEVTERSEVDAKYRHRIIAEHPRGRDHRPVAAEHDHQIDARRQLVVTHDLDHAPGLRLDLGTLDARRGDERDAARGEPLDQQTDGLHRLRLMRFDENADATNCGLYHFRAESTEEIIRLAPQVLNAGGETVTFRQTCRRVVISV